MPHDVLAPAQAEPSSLSSHGSHYSRMLLAGFHNKILLDHRLEAKRNSASTFHVAIKVTKNVMQIMPHDVLALPQQETSSIGNHCILSSRILLSGFQSAIAKLPSPAKVSTEDDSVKPMPAPPKPEAPLQSLEVGLRRAAPEPTSPLSRSINFCNPLHESPYGRERPLSKPINVLPVPGDDRAHPPGIPLACYYLLVPFSPCLFSSTAYPLFLTSGLKSSGSLLLRGIAALWFDTTSGRCAVLEIATRSRKLCRNKVWDARTLAHGPDTVIAALQQLRLPH